MDSSHATHRSYSSTAPYTSLTPTLSSSDGCVNSELSCSDAFIIPEKTFSRISNLCITGCIQFLQEESLCPFLPVEDFINVVFNEWDGVLSIQR